MYLAASVSFIARGLLLAGGLCQSQGLDSQQKIPVRCLTNRYMVVNDF